MSKQNVRIARRYARALYESSKLEELDGLYAAIADVTEAWRESIELRAALLNPAVNLEARRAVAKEMGTRAYGGRPELGNFLSVLLDNRRMEVLPEVADELKRIVDEVRKLLTLEVISAFPLDDAERSAFESRIREKFGTIASISWGVDESLIGGLVIKHGDRVLDTSIRGSLEGMRTALLS